MSYAVRFSCVGCGGIAMLLSFRTPEPGFSAAALLFWVNNSWFGAVLRIVLYPLDARCSWRAASPPVESHCLGESHRSVILSSIELIA